VTIVLGSGVEHGAHPSVLAHADTLEGVCIEVMARRLEALLDWQIGQFRIVVENDQDIITTIEEIHI
jgi:hypothetical protein